MNNHKCNSCHKKDISSIIKCLSAKRQEWQLQNSQSNAPIAIDFDSSESAELSTDIIFPSPESSYYHSVSPSLHQLSTRADLLHGAAVCNASPTICPPALINKSDLESEDRHDTASMAPTSNVLAENVNPITSVIESEEKENDVPVCTHIVEGLPQANCLSPVCTREFVERCTPLREEMYLACKQSVRPYAQSPIYSSNGASNFSTQERLPLMELKWTSRPSYESKSTGAKLPCLKLEDSIPFLESPSNPIESKDQQENESMNKDISGACGEVNFTSTRSRKRVDSSDDDEDAFEKFLAQQRQELETKQEVIPAVSLDSFIVSDDEVEEVAGDGSEIGATVSFYHQVDNCPPIRKPLGSLPIVPQDKKKEAGQEKIVVWSSSSENEDDLCNSDLEELGRSHVELSDAEKSSDSSSSSSATSSSDEEELVLPRCKAKFKTDRQTPVSRVAEGDRLNFLASLSNSCDPERRHLDAVKYVKSFNSNKKELMSRLFELYNKEVFENKLPANMEILWSKRLLKTAGYCKYWRRGRNRLTALSHPSSVVSGEPVVNPPLAQSHSAQIQLSLKVCADAERLRDTLIHELCHAAVWVLEGINDGHGPRWKHWAHLALYRCPGLGAIKRCHDYTIETRFTYQCSRCLTTINRHSKSLDVNKKVCGVCRGKFNLLVNTPTGRRRASQVLKTPNPFAQFVRENYKAARQGSQSKSVTHAEAMKQLSNQFKELKMQQKQSNAASIETISE